jgi:hypothetical protein
MGELVRQARDRLYGATDGSIPPSIGNRGEIAACDEDSKPESGRKKTPC